MDAHSYSSSFRRQRGASFGFARCRRHTRTFRRPIVAIPWRRVSVALWISCQTSANRSVSRLPARQGCHCAIVCRTQPCTLSRATESPGWPSKKGHKIRMPNLKLLLTYGAHTHGAAPVPICKAPPQLCNGRNQTAPSITHPSALAGIIPCRRVCRNTDRNSAL